MIIRIVKMSFLKEHQASFYALFQEVMPSIKAFPGCKDLQLLKEDKNSSILATLSIWETAEDLENYRQSELFKKTWKQTKALFNDKPQAWSFEPIEL